MSDRTTLKGYFNTGDVPTEAQFADLIDSLATTDEVSAKQDVVSGVSSTEIGYLDGVTSAIQAQIDSKQATLSSGTNIKTLRTVSILGSGDISINTVHVVASLFDVPESAIVGDLIVLTGTPDRWYKIDAISPSLAYTELLIAPATHTQAATTILYAESAMGALAINTGASINTKSISTDVTMTFSAAPTAGTMFSLEVTNTDASPHTVTIPSSYSYARQGAITSFVVPASGRAEVAWRYDGSGYVIYGDPVATTGSGDYVLNDNPTLDGATLTDALLHEGVLHSPTGTTVALSMSVSNMQVIDLGSSTGNVVVTVTPPTGKSAQCVITVKNHATTARNLTFAVSGGADLLQITDDFPSTGDATGSIKNLSLVYNHLLDTLTIASTGVYA